MKIASGWQREQLKKRLIFPGRDARAELRIYRCQPDCGELPATTIVTVTLELFVPSLTIKVTL